MTPRCPTCGAPLTVRAVAEWGDYGVTVVDRPWCGACRCVVYLWYAAPAKAKTAAKDAKGQVHERH